MMKITGIRYKKDAKGRNRYITIDLHKWGEKVEDFLDMLEVEAIRNSPEGEIVATHEEVKQIIEKKHGIKL